MRRAFAQGHFEQLPQCKICQDTEQAGGHAARFGANLHFTTNCRQIDLIEEIQKIIDNDYYSYKVATMDWFPSNYCNYSCLMCAGGASSTRMTFEILHSHQPQRIVHNAETNDFQAIIDDLEVINFTGGETVMQKKVTDMIKVLASRDNAKDKTIFLLTNVSSYPDELMNDFKKFYRVIYMCSIDGVGPVIEYQRRNCSWSTVEANSLKLLKHEFIATIINYVVTSVNVLSFVHFADWIYNNNITRGISISPVFRNEYLGTSALPPDLRSVALARLDTGLEKYSLLDDDVAKRCVEIILSVKSIIESTPYNANHMTKFIQHIRLEDTDSDRKFLEVVPEWRLYFDNSTQALS